MVTNLVPPNPLLRNISSLMTTLSIFFYLKVFKEGNPSAKAALQGSLHLTTNIHAIKFSTKVKKKRALL